MRSWSEVQQGLPLPAGRLTPNLRLPWPRAGWQVEAATALALLLVAIVGIGYQYLGEQGSAPITLQRYLNALQAGDASTVWSLQSLEAPAPGVDSSLMNKAGLVAFLATPANRHRFSQPRLGSVATDSRGDALIATTYRDSDGPQRTTFRLRAGPSGVLRLPTWRVVVAPAVLAITRPLGSGEVSVDGIAVVLQPGSSGNFAAYPGTHSIAVAASPLTNSATQTVTASDAPKPITVLLAPTLTDGGQRQALAAVAQAMSDCGGRTDAIPTGCPQSFPKAAAGKDIHWQLLGDPVAGAQTAAAGNSISVAGHFQMLLNYFDGALSGVRHVAVAGPYRAHLVIAGDSLKVSEVVQSSDTPPADRPAAITDAAVRDAVRPLFARCAAATTFTAVDCPMQMSRLDGSSGINITWSLNGDPLSGSSVVFDGSAGAFLVTGSFSMTCHYDSPGLVTFHHDDSDTGRFSAMVLPASGQPVSGGIDRVS